MPLLNIQSIQKNRKAIYLCNIKYVNRLAKLSDVGPLWSSSLRNHFSKTILLLLLVHPALCTFC